VGFARRDVKERRVEAGYVAKKAALIRGNLAERERTLVVQGIRVPALLWDLAHRVAPLAQQPPELLDRIRARAAARHATDGDRLAPCGLAALQQSRGLVPT